MKSTLSSGGEFGWGDTDSPAFGGAGAALFAAVTLAYCGSIWLASGLAPIAYVAGRVGSSLGIGMSVGEVTRSSKLGGTN